jgi:DNA-directed RNA polymerase specialized sigma24 family protein
MPACGTAEISRFRRKLFLIPCHSSQSDIAAALGCSVKAVETRIYRARQMLRGLLDGEAR